MTDPENEQPQPPNLEADQPETVQADDEAPQDAAPERGSSSQRTRTILAGLVTVAILAVLAIAIFDGGSDDEEPEDPPATVVDEVATTGGDGNQEVADGPELGSLAVTGYLCPSSSSSNEECMEPGPVEILNATIRLADGTTMQLPMEARQGDDSYAWLNIPIGEYVLLADGLLGPGGTPARDVVGSTGQVEDGWTISNTDPNQPAVLQVFFVPVEDAEAAG